MMKKALSLILSVILILSVCVIPQFGFAAEGLSKTFSTADNASTLLGWSLPAGYVLSDADGVTHTSTQKRVLYTGGVFSGKFEYSVEFKLVYENPGRVITNYVDDSNYYYIEVNPKKNDITFKTFRRGIVSTHGAYKLPYTIKSGNAVTARVISNGGEGVSFFLKVGDNPEATIFENVYVKDYIAEGAVGYAALYNPLKVNNFKVNLLGDKDFVPPVEEEKPEDVPGEVPGEEDEEEVIPADKVYDERPLKVVTALGIMDAAALENGKAQVTLEEFKTVISNLEGEFTGEGKITLNVAMQEIIKVLGYHVKVGSKNSYLMQANDLKLLRGIDLKTSDAITRYDLAMLIYNAFDVDVLQTTAYSDKVTYTTVPGQTLLTKVLKIGKVEGQVTDNGVTSLTRSSQVNQQHFVINGYKFLLLRNNVNRNDYIGRYVEAYYDDSDHDNKEILYIDYSEEEDVLVITPETYAGYSNGVFTYYEDNKTRKATFVVGNPVIYNGYYRTSYPRQLFDGIDHGSITLVSNGTSSYTTMIIKDYESIYVNGIVDGKFYVYNKAHDGVPDDATVYDFEYPVDDNANNKSYVPIFDTEGNRLEFSDITVGSVVSIAKATVPNVAEMIVSTESVEEFEINETYTEEGFQVLSNFEESYRVNTDYANAVDAKTFKLGHVVTLYLDAFGYVTWADFMGEQELYVGVLVDSGLGTGFGGKLEIAVYETDGEQQIFTTADKIRFRDTDGTESIKTKSELASRIAGLNEIVAYTLDDNDLITSFELPLDPAYYSIDADNHCTKIADVASGVYNYQNLSMSWNFDYFTGSGCKYFTVRTTDLTDLESYSLTSVSYDNAGDTCKMKLYSIDGDCMVDYGILYDFDGGDTGLTPKKREMVVTGTSVVYDEESNLTLNKIQGFVSSGVTLYADDDVMNNAKSLMTYADKDASGNSTAKTYRVQKGDIIKYSVDQVTGRAEEIIIVYRNNMTAPSGSQGWILDAAGGLYVDETSKPNPFAISSTFGISNGNVAQRAGSRRYILGWVYDKHDGIIEVTNQDLSTGNTYWNESGNETSTQYVSELHRISAYTLVNTTFMDDKEETVSVKAGNAADIKSYKEVGRNCSRVLIGLSGNEAQNLNMIILNEE